MYVLNEEERGYEGEERLGEIKLKQFQRQDY
jgi:hypothetical protein